MINANNNNNNNNNNKLFLYLLVLYQLLLRAIFEIFKSFYNQRLQVRRGFSSYFTT